MFGLTVEYPTKIIMTGQRIISKIHKIHKHHKIFDFIKYKFLQILYMFKQILDFNVLEIIFTSAIKFIKITYTRPTSTIYIYIISGCMINKVVKRQKFYSLFT